jgi:hypothetical protein
MSDHFKQQLAAFMTKTDARLERVTDRVSEMARDSIRVGSPITGAPGQPVLSGRLRDSWFRSRLGQFLWRIASDAPYAATVEFKTHAKRFANHGPHSVRLTVVGFKRLLAAALREVLQS